MIHLVICNSRTMNFSETQLVDLQPIIPCNDANTAANGSEDE